MPTPSGTSWPCTSTSTSFFYDRWAHVDPLFPQHYSWACTEVTLGPERQHSAAQLYDRTWCRTCGKLVMRCRF
ncbi:hypothetical protein BD413DRAFT_556173 [Trametes elegans]|nr:hypothetical protein BD413DRAFT_556173 [Trametes elegans]